MANVQHNSLTDPNLHEPKGVSTAASGKVYVANGGGSGSWEYISGHSFGELYVEGGVTAQTLSASNALAKLNPTGEWTVNGNKNMTLSATNGTLTVFTAGEYQLNFWAVFDTAAIATGAAYNFHYNVNGVSSTRKVYVKKISNGVDTLNVTALGFVTLPAGAVISMYVGGDATSSGTNITVREASLSALLVDAS
jgi:hypothetical protein